MKPLFSLAITLSCLLLLGGLPGCGNGGEGSADTAGGGSASADTPELQPAFDAEFLTRPDGYEGLADFYDFEFNKSPLQMDPGLMYKACAEGSVDVIDAFATDGRIEAFDLHVLKDDKDFFPPYYAAPLIRQDVLDKHPEIAETLGKLAGKIDNKAMRQLNYRVDEKGERAENVARDWLEKQELIPAGEEPAKGTGDTVVIGGKQFTEQEVLGELMAILLEHHTDLKIKRKLNLGGTMICFNAIKADDLDIYPEYTGTGLVSILKEEKMRDPQKVYDHVKQVFDEKWNLVWLEPFGIDNTYTLTMRGEQANALGIESISDLAAYVNEKQKQ